MACKIVSIGILVDATACYLAYPLNPETPLTDRFTIAFAKAWLRDMRPGDVETLASMILHRAPSEVIADWISERDGIEQMRRLKIVFML